MLAELVDHVIGIDPDRDRVTAAVVASNTTAVVATGEFQACASGYDDLVAWANAHSSPDSRAWSIEGTRSYGTGATLTLEAADEWVIEFDRPTTAPSKDRAKTDALDAIRAAREALGRDKLTTITDLDTHIKKLVDEMAPQLLDEIGINYTTAA